MYRGSARVSLCEVPRRLLRLGMTTTALALCRFCIHQREDAFLLRAVIERTKHADLVEPPHAVEGIEKLRVARGQLRGFEITPPQILRLERARIFRREQME